MAREFGTILTANRKRVGLSQENLAKKAKIERTYMSKLESMSANPSFSTIEKLGKGLGMTLAEFFGEEQNDKEPNIVFLENREFTRKKTSQKIKAEMVPIKVFRDIRVFSKGIDIQKEFAPKFTYVEKSVLFGPNWKEFEPYEMQIRDFVGLEIEHRIDVNEFHLLRSSILIVFLDIKSIVTPCLCIIASGDGKGPSIQKYTEVDEYSIFFNPTRNPLWHDATHIFKEDDLPEEFIRGIIIGTIGRVGDAQ